MEVYEMSGQRERDRVRKIIHDAKKGRVSDKRAKALLEKYGGDQYRISSVFEVAITDGNGTAFGEAARTLGEGLNENSDPIFCPYCGNKASVKIGCVEMYKGTEYTFDKNVCNTDPSHEWQTGEQMDATVSKMIEINKQRKNHDTPKR